jgi:hypothetical protein
MKTIQINRRREKSGSHSQATPKKYLKRIRNIFKIKRARKRTPVTDSRFPTARTIQDFIGASLQNQVRDINNQLGDEGTEKQHDDQHKGIRPDMPDQNVELEIRNFGL